MRKNVILVALLAMSGGAMAQGSWEDLISEPEIIDNINKQITISKEGELAWIAYQVNEGESDFDGFDGYTITLNKDLDFLGHIWKPIGYGDELDGKSFKGTFNGKDEEGNIHTIKHLDVKNGCGVGLFGCIYNATIKNLILEDCHFTGEYNVGAIVGNNGGSTYGSNNPNVGIYNCHVGSGVTVTAEGENEDDGLNAGGIIGCLSSITVSNCTSAATVKGVTCVGGIAGLLLGEIIDGKQCGEIDDCYYLGYDIQASDEDLGEYGTIVGARGYPDPDTEGAIQKGTEGRIHITLFDNDVNNNDIIINNNSLNNEQRIFYYLGMEDISITIQGRTLYRDGSWNTLCLPFSPIPGTTTPLEEGNPVVQELEESTYDEETNTLNLVFKELTNGIHDMSPRYPYIVKWNAGTPLENPTFNHVVMVGSDVSEPNDVEQDNVSFCGIYTTIDIFTTEKTNLYLGYDSNEKTSKLYYPWGNEMEYFYINSFRAYFKLIGLTADQTSSSNGINNFVLNFGGESTGIKEISNPISHASNSSEWFSLDGRKWDSKPKAKGIYVNNGQKVVIK